MVKIGIATFFKCENYGAILQCFALQKVLRDNGYNAEVIDYTNIKESYPLYRRPLQWIWKMITAFLHRKKIAGIKKFIDNNMKLSRRYENYQELKKLPPECDMFIAGSDQIWIPRNAHELFFFLDFVPPGKARLSYAASFGIAELPKCWKEHYRTLLQKFTQITVRETEGRKIVEELVGGEAKVVLDPTLLLTVKDWDALSKPYPIEGKYVICYHIRQDKQMVQAISNAARIIAERQNCRVIHLCLKDYIRLEKNEINIQDAGPAEFLSLMKNSTAVVSDSFHGTVFSLVFSRPFAIFAPQGEKKTGISSRLTTLLSIVGLEERICDLATPFDSQIFFQKIDFPAATQKLMQSRQESLNVLWEMLASGIKNENIG